MSAKVLHSQTIIKFFTIFFTFKVNYGYLFGVNYMDMGRGMEHCIHI